jgi:Kef-type K+ transport system membrane component KefB
LGVNHILWDVIKVRRIVVAPAVVLFAPGVVVGTHVKYPGRKIKAASALGISLLLFWLGVVSEAFEDIESMRTYQCTIRKKFSL